MADAMRTAEYSKEDGPYVLPIGFQQASTTELTALQTAKKLNIGSLYYDITTSRIKWALRKDLLSSEFQLVGVSQDVSASRLILPRTDSSGTPGNVTNNSMSGRAAFAAAGTAVVVTNSQVTTTSEIFIQLRTADATLTIARVTAQAAGSFTVTGNAAATAIAAFSFLVTN
jgi:hypothetical protein